jgi:hypothetical protein
MITVTAASGGSSQGGPIQSGPIQTGRWNSRQRSSQPGSTGSDLTSANARASRFSPVSSV